MTSAKPIHEGVAPQVECHDGTEPTAIQPEQKEEVLVRGKSGRHLADTVSVFVKERKGKMRASGNLEMGGQKWPLNFHPYYGALEAIPKSQDNAAWHATMSGEVADLVLPVERQHTGVAAKSTMSPLYGPTDSHGYKPPVMLQQSVILHWQGGVPTRATIIDGDDRINVDLKQQSSELFKGTIKLTPEA